MPQESKQKEDDIAQLHASIKRLTEDVPSLSQSLADVVNARVGQATDDLRDGVKTAAEEISEKGMDSKDAIERAIRERPFQSLLGAFGVGLLIAHLFRKQGSS